MLRPGWQRTDFHSRTQASGGRPELADWLSSFKRKNREETPDQVLELLVLEGEDAGQKFTIDANNVAIARGIPRSGQPGAILLRDPTISGQQAMISRKADGTVIEHHRGATNPTLVNGQVITSAPIRPGDQIQMGRVKLEVRGRDGFVLGTLLESSGEHESQVSEPDEQTDETTEVRAVVVPGYSLVVVSGIEGAEGKVLRLNPPSNTIGRDPSSAVHIDVKAVSRRHAEIVWEGEKLFVVHHSSVNQTFVNGVVVSDRVEISPGDEIQLADCVVLRLDHQGPPPVSRAEPPKPTSKRTESPRTDPNQTSLQVRMEEKLAFDREIQEKYAVHGSFLDVDVVGSYGMKSESKRPELIIVSFERWRAWITGVIEEFNGMVLNSNGDELMCFFESTSSCVDAGRAILDRLDAFNEQQNTLPSPFRLRIGIHTGSSLVDKKRGVAYSEVLDVAGHLQKDADQNGLLISEPTLQALADEAGFEPAGQLEREQIATYRMVR